MVKEFDQLVKATLAKIKDFGITSRTVIKVFEQSCRLLKAYLEQNGLEFSYENGQAWLSEIQSNKPQTNAQSSKQSSQRRAVRLLSEYQEGRLTTWRIYSPKIAVRPKTTEYIELLQAYEEKLRADGMAKATIAFGMRVASDFLIYLETSGKQMINNIVAHDVAGYFTQETFSGRKPEGVKAFAYKLKSFLVFLEETGIVNDKKLNLAVPKVFAKQESIVTILSEKAVKVLRTQNNKVDESAAARNHAMILMALRLGIRQSDIIKMKLTDIDWKNNSLSFTQQKTGVPVTLPLLPEVGNAIMDYILHCRPKTPDDFIFLRHRAPYTPLSSCRRIAFKALSGLGSEDCPQRGFHIMRRTCATSMLKNNIPRSIISASIGQLDPNSVDVYLSADEEKMGKCALSLSGIECARGELR